MPVGFNWDLGLGNWAWACWDSGLGWLINILLADLVGEVVGVDIFKIEAADRPDILPINILETPFNTR